MGFGVSFAFTALHSHCSVVVCVCECARALLHFPASSYVPFDVYNAALALCMQPYTCNIFFFLLLLLLFRQKRFFLVFFF